MCENKTNEKKLSLPYLGALCALYMLQSSNYYHFIFEGISIILWKIKFGSQK